MGLICFTSSRIADSGANNSHGKNPMLDGNASASVVATGSGAAEARANNVTKRMEKTLICILRNWTDG